MAFTQGEVRILLLQLHDAVGSYPEISKGNSMFHKIPPGTLSSITRSGKVPKKWRRQLNCKVDPRPRIAIHKKDMHSAANSILDNIEPGKIKELYWHLGAEIEKLEAEKWNSMS
jgi:hypothetical protein